MPDNDLTQLPPDPYDEPDEQSEGPSAHAAPEAAEPTAPADDRPKHGETMDKSRLMVMLAVVGVAVIAMFCIGIYQSIQATRAPAATAPLPQIDAIGLAGQKPTADDYAGRFPAPIKIPSTGNAATSYTASTLPPRPGVDSGKNPQPQYQTYASTDAPQPTPDTGKPQPVKVNPNSPTWNWGIGSNGKSEPQQQPQLGFFFPDYRQATGATAAATMDVAGGLTNGLVKATEIQTQTEYQKQNSQSQKNDFLAKQEGNYSDYSQNTWSPPIDPGHELKAGWVIPAILLTQINTDNPGSVEAQVFQDVRDSYTGTRILIRAGARLQGVYNSDVSFQQSRVQIKWLRLIRNDHTSISLVDSAAVDSSGASGVAGDVDSHYADIATAVTISSAFDLGVNSATAYIAGLPGMGALASTLQSKQSVTQELSNQIISRVLNRQPTITVPQGTIINALIQKDIILPEER